jgi:hypothetical protein
MRLYVVCDRHTSYRDDPGAKIWTLSETLEDTGWETDSGFPGYGLTRAMAEYIAGCVNAANEEDEE